MDWMLMRSENELYERVLCGHLSGMAHFLRLLPKDKWDWTPDPAAPTPRILAAHAYQWLVCDRQHIENSDVSTHPDVPEPQGDPVAMIAALEDETERWRVLLRSLTPERLDAPVGQFGEGEGNVRGFVGHMIGNAVYKNGQFSTLFFALGLDGTEPYDAPWPNPIYKEVRTARKEPESP